jgi:cation transporter-like permease
MARKKKENSKSWQSARLAKGTHSGKTPTSSREGELFNPIQIAVTLLKSGEVIVYTGTIAKAATCGREQ